MRVLVFGCGEVVEHLTPVLIQAGHEVLVLDEHEGGTCVAGSQMETERYYASQMLIQDLQRCDIDDMDGFMALCSSDSKNAMAAQIAAKIFNVPQVVCHIGDLVKFNAYKELGLPVISSTQSVVESVTSLLRQQN